jgi:hypothetical protein
MRERPLTPPVRREKRERKKETEEIRHRTKYEIQNRRGETLKADKIIELNKGRRKRLHHKESEDAVDDGDPAVRQLVTIILHGFEELQRRE